MPNSPQLGNRILLLAVAMGLAIGSLYVQWGTVIPKPEDFQASVTMGGTTLTMNQPGAGYAGMFGGMLGNVKIPVTGRNGFLPLGSIRIPFWVGIGATAFGLILVLTNLVRFSAVPRPLIGLLLLSGVITSAWGLAIVVQHGSLGVGPFLLFAAAIIGFLRGSEREAVASAAGYGR